jgi:hypothetical protein
MIIEGFVAIPLGTEPDHRQEDWYDVGALRRGFPPDESPPALCGNREAGLFKVAEPHGKQSLREPRDGPEHVVVVIGPEERNGSQNEDSPLPTEQLQARLTRQERISIFIPLA